MVEIRPFRAIRYAKSAGNPEHLIAQPYDKISQDMQKEYYTKSEHNYCRLTLPIETQRYSVSTQRINQWIEEGILKRDKTPAVFIYQQEFSLLGESHTRTGFIAALRLHPYEENKVLPHETTHRGPKIDRLNMLRATEKNLETLFLLYPDPARKTVNLFAEITETKPLIDTKDSLGTRNLFWRVPEPEKIKRLQETLRNKQLVIADGHHRYETALAYRDERRKQEEWDENSAFNFRMSYMVPIQDAGLIVLPTHRLLTKIGLTDDILQKLTKFFSTAKLDPTPKSLRHYLESHKQEHAFCIYNGKDAFGLLLKDEKVLSKLSRSRCSEDYRALDVVILKEIIFSTIMKTGELKIDEDILYVRWIQTALEKVDNGEALLAFLVNPVAPKTVLDVARRQERMPEKSTDFYPKMVSGFTMMDVSPGEKL